MFTFIVLLPPEVKTSGHALRPNKYDIISNVSCVISQAGGRREGTGCVSKGRPPQATTL